jgi:hypothetical protein
VYGEELTVPLIVMGLALETMEARMHAEQETATAL